MNREVRKKVWGVLLSFFLIISFINCNLFGQAEDEVILKHISVEAEIIGVIAGESTIVRTPWPAIRVAVTDPKIANVQVLTPNQVLLQGLKVGTTDFIIWSEDEEEIYQWRVRVTLDPAYYEEKLSDLFPDCALSVQQSKEALVIKGLLRGNDQVVQLNKFFEQTGEKYVDMTSVAGIQQVQLEVRVAEVSKTALRSLGVNAITAQDRFIGVSRVGSSGSSILGPLLGLGGEGGPSVGIGGEDLSGGSFWTMFLGFPNSDLAFFLEALAENSYLRILANPTLVALSGEEASFLAGGEFPIPVVQGSGGAGVGGSSSISIEYREYGVRLVFKPLVQGDGTIRLFVAPEVSDLTNVGAVQIEDFVIPALFTRKASTTLELRSGQSFAMAGLIQHNVDAIRSVVPGIGELPVLGPLFRSVRYEEQETELVILVTATLVEPLSLTSMPPLPGSLHVDPNDWEFYLQGQIQGRRPVSISPEDSEWLQELGLDELAGPGAWDSYDSALSTYGSEDNG
ncbi:MAG: type II and III secretion system protein family protein [Planctomycetota bacterium]|jgi:pilus assembly protein CpaC